MQINLINKLSNKLSDKQKTILEGIIRSCVFLVVMRELEYYSLEYITGPLGYFISICASAIMPEFNFPTSEEFNDAMFLPTIVLIGFVCFTFNTYILAKLCGILKYFSQFKFWKSCFFLLVISISLFYFYILNLHTFKLNYSHTLEAVGVLTIIPAYVVYLFFNFLTKKFPTPFNQIGYFFSNEFYKDLYKRVIKKKRKD